MSKYTKAEPFEFGGVKVWRNADYVETELLAVGHDEAEAVHAMVEAERNEWHWTNDEHTEARKGRWTIRRPDFEGAWYLFHDDLTDGEHITAIFHDGTSPEHAAMMRGISPGCVATFNDFLTWHAAQQQPAEPTGFGYVGTVDGEYGLLDVMHGDGNRPDLFWVIGREDGCHYGQRTWSDVLALGKFEGVTR